MESKNGYSEALEDFLRDLWSRARNMMEVVEHEIMKSAIEGRVRGGAEEGRNPGVKLMEDMVRVRRSSLRIGIRVWSDISNTYLFS